MHLGIRLRELWRMRFALPLSLLVALLLALLATYRIGVLPPSLEPRSVDLASASTHVLVDTPRSAVLDLRQGTAEVQGMTNRAVLLGNVMASLPVREYIARRARISPDEIVATTPTTPLVPRPVVDPENRPHTSDLLKSTDQYRLNIVANPSVPVLDVYTEAPSARAAETLANAAVDGLRDYLGSAARAQTIPSEEQVQLTQLGRARGGLINAGSRLQVFGLVFGFAFVGSCAAFLLFARARAGWRASAWLDAMTARPEEPAHDDEPEQPDTARERSGAGVAG